MARKVIEWGFTINIVLVIEGFFHSQTATRYIPIRTVIGAENKVESRQRQFFSFLEVLNIFILVFSKS